MVSPVDGPGSPPGSYLPVPTGGRSVVPYTRTQIDDPPTSSGGAGDRRRPAAPDAAVATPLGPDRAEPRPLRSNPFADRGELFGRPFLGGAAGLCVCCPGPGSGAGSGGWDREQRGCRTARCCRGRSPLPECAGRGRACHRPPPQPAGYRHRGVGGGRREASGLSYFCRMLVISRSWVRARSR